VSNTGVGRVRFIGDFVVSSASGLAKRSAMGKSAGVSSQSFPTSANNGAHCRYGMAFSHRLLEFGKYGLVREK
jgi:hypothetical protein